MSDLRMPLSVQHPKNMVRSAFCQPRLPVLEKTILEKSDLAMVINVLVTTRLGMQVVLWSKPLSLGLADRKVGGSNPRNGVSSRRLVPAPANLAVRKHVEVQVDK